MKNLPRGLKVCSIRGRIPVTSKLLVLNQGAYVLKNQVEISTILKTPIFECLGEGSHWCLLEGLPFPSLGNCGIHRSRKATDDLCPLCPFPVNFKAGSVNSGICCIDSKIIQPGFVKQALNNLSRSSEGLKYHIVPWSQALTSLHLPQFYLIKDNKVTFVSKNISTSTGYENDGSSGNKSTIKRSDYCPRSSVCVAFDRQ